MLLHLTIKRKTQIEHKLILQTSFIKYHVNDIVFRIIAEFKKKYRI